MYGYRLAGIVKKAIVSSVFLALAAVCVACASDQEGGHAGWRSDSFGYQYDRPGYYCIEIQTQLGLEMYCPEGMVFIEFITPDLGDTIDQVLADVLDETNSSLEYSLTEVNGKQSRVVLAELNDANQTWEGKDPTHIAVLPFGNSMVAVLRGFPHRGEFEQRLGSTFILLVTSLEPF